MLTGYPTKIVRVVHLPSGTTAEVHHGLLHHRHVSLNRSLRICLRILKAKVANPIPLPQPLIRTWDFTTGIATDHRTKTKALIPEFKEWEAAEKLDKEVLSRC